MLLKGRREKICSDAVQISPKSESRRVSPQNDRGVNVARKFTKRETSTEQSQQIEHTSIEILERE